MDVVIEKPKLKLEINKGDILSEVKYGGQYLVSHKGCDEDNNIFELINLNGSGSRHLSNIIITSKVISKEIAEGSLIHYSKNDYNLILSPKQEN